MIQKANQFAILALTLVVGLAACDKKKEDAPQAVNQGDPLVLVKNTTATGNTPIPQFVFAENSDWALEVKGFAENPAVNLENEFKGGIDAILGQNPSDKIFAYEPYRMIKSATGVWTVFQPSNSSSLRLDFYTTTEKQLKGTGTVAPIVVTEKAVLNNVDLFDKEQFSVLHTSYNDARDAFSILLYSSKPGNRRLVALYFYRWAKPAAESDALAGDSLNYENSVEGQPVVQQNEVELEKPFNYTYGQKYKAIWDRKVELKICGATGADLQNVATGAVDQWKGRLDGGMNLDYKVEAKCPPFSDLKSQTYTYVDGFNPNPRSAGRVFGDTVSVTNFASSRILDGDVIVFMSEIQKTIPQNINAHDPRAFTEPGVRTTFELTALKNMGFLLGLGEAPAGTQSIMSNDVTRNGVTDYDKEAILSLYPNDNAFFSTLNKWF